MPAFTFDAGIILLRTFSVTLFTLSDGYQSVDHKTRMLHTFCSLVQSGFCLDQNLQD